MEVVRLSKAPHLFTQVIELIEAELGYEDHHHFEIDFYPLMNKANHDNCFVLIFDNEVVGHIGVKTRILQYKDMASNVLLIGGVAIKSNYQGKGLFKDFFKSVLLNYSGYSLAFLWSDLNDLYRKFDFYEAGRIFATGEQPPTQKLLKDHGFSLVNLKDLNSADWEQIKKLYRNFLNDKPSLLRNEKDWQDIQEITSMNFYVRRKNGQIVSYFFAGKGMDLKDIVHEYIHADSEILDFPNEIKIWHHSAITTPFSKYYGFLIKILDLKKFYTDFKFSGENLTAEKIDTFFTNDFPIHIFGCDSI